ncbi:MAG: hypothetical protein H0U76_24430 [Ktedonobacteraceae bacterium]|nr:hypothetical protein [Ktedonobacteraceae bacterium]
MPGDKAKLSSMLNKQTPQPVLRKGQGFNLSTEAQYEPDQSVQNAESAEVRNHTTAPPKPKRSKRGYELRDDLVRECKQIALDENRKLYQVMEQAIEEYLARHKVTDQPPS